MSHYVYCLIHGEEHMPCKIGITGNPKNRLRSYQTSSPQREFRMPHITEVGSREEAYKIEQTIIQACKDAGWWCKNEWIRARACVLNSMILDELNG